MAHREFVDAAGSRWQVWDTRPRSKAEVRARYAGGWLSFESDGERRRLHPIPDGWEEVDDDTLRRWLMSGEFVGAALGTAVLEPSAAAAPRTAAPAERPRPAEAGNESTRAGALWQATQAALRRAREVMHLVDVTTGTKKRGDTDPGA
ncbi:MAG TPA: hypothetical protein VGB24_10150 [Longimicrobium sp.]|jgi:hypothetical protein|uniref:hypothetical protein n=1 Tax=Longimicrobium sp. TaxID=2029185 RepID=UPI002ED8F760